MTERDSQRLLTDIYHRLGSIEAKLEAVESHAPRIAKLEKFEGRVGAYIYLGGAIVSGVLIMLGQGAKYVIDYWVHK